MRSPKYKKEIIEVFGVKDGSNISIKHAISIDKESRLFELYVGKKRVARWSLVEMPGCCAVCIYTGAFVEPKFREKGFGGCINDLAIAIARHDKYTVMIATDVTDNYPQQKIFSANGWKEFYKFKNIKTDNEIGAYLIQLGSTNT